MGAKHLGGGGALLLAIWRYVVAKTSSEQAKAILGDWYGYAFFYHRDGDDWYKETITVTRSLIFPWRLNITASPITNSRSTIYRGTVRVRPPVMFVDMYEPVFADQTFEISKLLMDKDHYGRMCIGICLGKTYEDNHCAVGHVGTRKQLDPNASPTNPADPVVEKQAYKAICSRFFEVKPDEVMINLN